MQRYPLGEPPGFPNCQRCPYVHGGSSVQCVDCAAATITAVGTPSCLVCDQTLAAGEWCHNALCHRSDRSIHGIRAIAVHTGELRDCILRFKYDNKWGWATIFGRLLYGYVARHIDPSEYPIVTANPTYVGAGGRTTPHTELVVEAAEKEDLLGIYTWDVGTPRVLQKTRPTTPSAGGSVADKRQAADELAKALHVTAPDSIQGRHVLVYDDVCTTGEQLDAIARFLLGQGVASVRGIVLARAPWT